tara:strand:- start:5041 stop:5190 length:150 start_codon:yes stop_codon:yes gene_type:complete
MIKQILELLNISDWYGVSENVDIAKGKYKINDSLKEAYKQGLRKGYGRK